MGVIRLSDKNFRETAEKYRNEMMKIYGSKNTRTAEEKAEDTQPPVEADMEILIEKEKEDEDVSPSVTDDIEERFPPPEIPAFMKMDSNNTRPHPDAEVSYESGQTKSVSKIRETQWQDYITPENSDEPRTAESEIKQPECTKWGYLKINVRTGSGGIPVPNASVTLTKLADGREELLALTTTDINGETEVFRLPAPDSGGTNPEDYDKYSVYIAEVYSKGYYREVSRNIPIFENITSVQTFNLIPEPYSFDSGKNFIAYDNTEPEI